MSHDEYDRAVEELSSTSTTVQDAAPVIARAFPVTGAAVSTLGPFLGNETVSASDAVAARLDELQFDLGEGPCWDALSTKRPVLEPDLRHGARSDWPAFTPAALERDVSAVFAFPVTIGPLRIGAVDLYSSEPVELSPGQARRAVTLAALVGRSILRRAMSESADEPAEQGSRYSRRVIHQATGMVLAQLEVSAEEAGLVIQGHAFATDRSMMSVADDILAGRLNFSNGEFGIEASR